jgi:hypothetical protein
MSSGGTIGCTPENGFETDVLVAASRFDVGGDFAAGSISPESALGGEG